MPLRDGSRGEGRDRKPDLRAVERFADRDGLRRGHRHLVRQRLERLESRGPAGDDASNRETQGNASREREDRWQCPAAAFHRGELGRGKASRCRLGEMVSEALEISGEILPRAAQAQAAPPTLHVEFVQKLSATCR